MHIFCIKNANIGKNKSTEHFDVVVVVVVVVVFDTAYWALIFIIFLVFEGRYLIEIKEERKTNYICSHSARQTLSKIIFSNKKIWTKDS